LLQTTQEAALRWARAEAPRDEAQDGVVHLLDALRRHNLREEELLRGVLPTVDPWGRARAEIMSEEHVAEHRELYAALSAIVEGDNAAVFARKVSTLRDQLLEHMAREEKGFLGEDALHDEELGVDAFGG
jgi:hypothetical protein